MKSKDLIQSQLPSHFLEQYPQFVKFIEQYYEFLESTVFILEENKNISAGDFVYGSLSKAKAKIKAVSSNRIYFEYETKVNKFHRREILINQRSGELYEIKSIYGNIYEYIQNIEDNTCYDMALNLYKKFFRKNVSLNTGIFRRVDPNILTKRILDYYKNKGTENSFYWFFRIFFDEEIELYYPKVDILRLSDSDYRVRQWIQIERVEGYSKMKSASIYAKKSKTSAVVRDVRTTTIDGITKSFLDLVFVNGIFEINEEIIASDYITGEEIGRTIILPSPVSVVPTDGGINHQIEDRFRFGSIDSDGQGEVIEMKKYSITNIIPEHRGICYSVGNEIEFDNNFTGATVTAKARVSKVNKNEALTDWINSYSDSAGTIEIQKISSERIVDIWDRVIGESLVAAETNNVYSYTPSAFQSAASQVVDIGSIAEIEFERSGMNYKFAPKAFVSNEDIDSLKNFIYFEIVIDDNDLDFIAEDSIVEVFGRRGFCIGIKKYEEGTLDIGLSSEPFKVIQIIVDKPLDTTLGNITYPDTVIDTVTNGKLIDYINNETYFEFSEILDANRRIKLYPTSVTVANVGAAAYSDSSSFLNPNGTVQTESNVKFINLREIIKISPLNKTAELSSVIGEGVSKLKLTGLGLTGLEGFHPVFKSEVIERKPFVNPEYQTYDEFYQKIEDIHELKVIGDTINFEKERVYFGQFIEMKNFWQLMDWFDDGNKDKEIKKLVSEITHKKTRVSHNLPATMEYKYGAMYKPFGEYIDRGSHLSADKYIQDNYYYQNFSYEIRTKVEAKEIEPLLMDELHPAGFIMFVRNKFESELKLRLTAFEFPEIEIESRGLLDTIAKQVEAEIENSASPENHPGIQTEDVKVEPEIEVSFEEDLSVEELHEKEIEMERILEGLEAFYYFWEDVVTIPENFNLNNFRNYMKSTQRLDIINSTMMFDLVPAAQSYIVIQLLEDRANWRTVPIKYRAGPIGSLGKEPITNLRTSSEMNFLLTVSHDFGGVIIVRDDPYSVPVVVGNSKDPLEKHGFFPAAEVYTKRGWVQFRNLTNSEVIAHVEETGKITWKTMKKLYKRHYSGIMNHVTNEQAMTHFAALDRMVLKNIHVPISLFTNDVVVQHKSGTKVDDASVVSTPDTDLILYAINNRYQRVKSKNVILEGSSNFISTIEEDLLELPVSVINRNRLSAFRKSEFMYTGDVYTLSLEDIQPSLPAKMGWDETDLMAYNMMESKNQPKFGFSIKEVIQKVANISEIRTKDPLLSDSENANRIETVKFGETVMYLLNVNEERKGTSPRVLDDSKMVRFAGFEIPLPSKLSETKTDIINVKMILDRDQVFDLNGNIRSDTPISQLFGGRLWLNMGETIPTVKAGEIDYSIFNITTVEHIKPTLMERYDKLHSFEEFFFELNSNQASFFTNTTNTKLPTHENSTNYSTIYVENTEENPPMEVTENLIDVETFAHENMFMKLNEQRIDIKIQRHIPDRWKCVDLDQVIPLDQPIGSLGSSNDIIWEKLRETIPTARIVETSKALIMEYDSTPQEKLESKERSTHIEITEHHERKTEADFDLFEVDIHRHLPSRWSLIDLNQDVPLEDIIAPTLKESKKIWNNIRESIPTARIVETYKEIDQLAVENVRKELEEKDVETNIVSTQRYEFELVGKEDYLEVDNETIIYNRNFVFDATKPIDAFGNPTIKDYYLKLRPRISINDTLPSGKISEFALEIHSLIESDVSHNLIDETFIHIDNSEDVGKTLEYSGTEIKVKAKSYVDIPFDVQEERSLEFEMFEESIIEANTKTTVISTNDTEQAFLDMVVKPVEEKLQNVNRIWNSNHCYEMDSPIFEMYGIPVSKLSTLALKESLDGISAPNGSSVVENFEIHQETMGNLGKNQIAETKYRVTVDRNETSNIYTIPLPNEQYFEKDEKVSVEFAYIFEKEIRTEKIVGDLVTEKFNLENSVHAMDQTELERLSGAIFSKKGSVSNFKKEKIYIDETKLNLSPIYRILKERDYETPWSIDEATIDFLTSQWATPYFDEVIEDYEDKILHHREENTYLRHNLNIQYVYGESIVYSANGITELLNSNNYIDENGTILTGTLNYEDIVNSSNTYIKTISAMETFYVD